MSTVQKPSRIIASKGMKQVGKITSAERGKTVICCMNSIGNFIPPLFIFPRKRMTPLLMNDAPQGFKGCVSSSGWTDGSIFLEWLLHFQKATNSSRENQCILILDNHASHVFLPAINFARRNGIIILSIPPHTSHRLQPLDIPFFGPLKTFYGQEADKWMLNHPGRRISEYEVCKLFKGAYERAATMRNAASGFRAAGIVPYDRNVFSESDFALSLTTEIEECTAVVQNLENNDAEIASDATEVNDNNRLPSDDVSAIRPTLAEGTADMPCHSAANEMNPSSIEDREISFQDLSPLPNAKISQRKRKGKRSEIITRSPFKKSILDKAARTPKQKAVRKRGKAKKNLPMNQSVHDINYYCLVCHSPYEEPLTEDWIECSVCKKWCHDKCTDYSGRGLFICDLCKEG